MHPLITALLAQAPGLAVARDTMRAKPTKRAAEKSGRNLVKAYGERAKELAGDREPVAVNVQQNVAPTGKELIDLLKNPDTKADAIQKLNALNYAANISDYGPGVTGQMDVLHGKRRPATILTNPNADEMYFAHELGHSASTNTSVGDNVRRLRDFVQSNPQTARSLQVAGALLPFSAAAITPGDDDLDEAIIGSMALTSPALIDEALATKNAIDIMKKAGRPPTMGQYGRMAGGYLSYLAMPLTSAILANSLGNQLD